MKGPFSKNTKRKKTWAIAQVEYSSSKHEALSSSPSTVKKLVCFKQDKSLLKWEIGLRRDALHNRQHFLICVSSCAVV
jgi:hypothetical protein